MGCGRVPSGSWHCLRPARRHLRVAVLRAVAGRAVFSREPGGEVTALHLGVQPLTFAAFSGS
jgi:hypothetical protein